MNILFLTPRDSRKNLGGVEKHVRILTEELARRGHQIKELSLDEVGIPVVRLPLPPIKSGRRGVATTGFGRSGDILSQAPKYRDRPKMWRKIEAWVMLWRNKSLFKWTDIIHVHDVFWWLLPYVLLNRLGLLGGSFNLLNKVAKRDANDANWHTNDANKGKIYTTFHGWEGVYPPTRSAVWQKRLAQKLSRGTIGVGRFFKRWYGVESDKVVWGAIQDFRVQRAGGRVKKGELKIVFFGRLEEVNGIEILLRALKVRPWRTLRSDLFRCVFVGDGSYRLEAERFGVVTGMVRNPYKYLVDADLVIASSYMSMLEAAGLGKPIISVATNPLKEDYLDGHPLREYIKVVKSADELYKGLTLVSQGETLKNLEAARVWALGQTPEKLADTYESLWKIPIN